MSPLKLTRAVLVGCLALAVAILLWRVILPRHHGNQLGQTAVWAAPRAADGTALAPPPPPGASTKASQRGTNGASPGTSRLPHLKRHPEELSDQERAEFERKFKANIKPAIGRWFKVYKGHVPFRLEEATADRLRELAWGGTYPGGNTSLWSYGFVIGGTTLAVTENHGRFVLDYLMSPDAMLLLKTPSNPEPPKPVSISGEEVMRLIEADSGRDFPPDQVAMRPTAYAGAMNGGLSVNVGKGVNQPAMVFTDLKYTMVFGPDGNLACYGRGVTE